MTTDDIADVLCPECDGPMQPATINGDLAWECDVHGYILESL